MNGDKVPSGASDIIGGVRESPLSPALVPICLAECIYGRSAMFDQERGEKCGWCNAQDKKETPCAKLDEVGRRIALRTDREACNLEICAHYPEMISYA
jgi:hypothetical protein